MQRTVTRVAKRRPVAPAATGGESKEKLTRFDPDVWGGVSLYAKTMGLNDTQAINDLLRVALRSVATGRDANVDVYSAPTVALSASGNDEARTVLLMETMERMLCTSIGLLAELGEPGRPPRVSTESRDFAVKVQEASRANARKALGLLPEKRRDRESAA